MRNLARTDSGPRADPVLEYHELRVAYNTLRAAAAVVVALVMAVLSLAWDWKGGLVVAGLGTAVFLHALVMKRRGGDSPMVPLLVDTTAVGVAVVIGQMPVTVAAAPIVYIATGAVLLLPATRVRLVFTYTLAWLGIMIIGSWTIGHDWESEQVMILDGFSLVVFLGLIAALLFRAAQGVSERRDIAERLRGAFDNAATGMLLLDPEDGRIIQVNTSFCRLVGRDEQLVGQTVASITHPDDREAGMLSKRRLRSGDAASFQADKRFIHADGSVIWTAWSVSRVVDTEGGTRHLMAQAHDIGDRKRAEKDREKFAALVENSSDFIAMADLDGNLLYVNEAGLAMTGIAHHDRIASMTIAEFHPPEDQTRLRQMLAKIFEDGSWEGEIGLRNFQTGEVIPTDLRGFLVRDPQDGSPIAVAGILRDLTTVKQNEARLEQLVRSKDEFVASVSHEIRTPLTGVLGIADELNGNLDSFAPAEIEELVAVIADQSREMAHIVEDLLVVARADIDGLSLSSETVDLAAQAETVTELLDGPTPKIIGQAEPATADPARVRQIIRNLLTNAHRYGGEHIEVHLGSNRHQTHLDVRDDGPGIPDGEWQTIFAPYQRAHDNPGQPASVGLGLTVSRKLARLMHGDLTYRHTDGWSIFRLTLPTASSHHDSTQKSTESLELSAP